jgi:transposase-like protein
MIGRKNHWAQFRARVAFAALRGDRTPEELARRYGVSVEEVAAWSEFLRDHAADAFGLAELDPGAHDARTPEPLPVEVRRLEEALRDGDRELSRERADHAARMARQLAGLQAAHAEEITRWRESLDAAAAALRARDAALAARDAALADRDQHIEALDTALAAANARAAQLTASLSWRVTRPLRALGALVTRAPPAKDEVIAIAPRTPLRSRPSRPRTSRNIPPRRWTKRPRWSPPPRQRNPSTPTSTSRCIPTCGVIRRSVAPLPRPRETRRAGRHAAGIRGHRRFRRARSRSRHGALVSHEASRTGAPILCLELARRMRGRHNVVVLLLQGGAMTEAFKAAADVVVGPLAFAQRDSELIVSCTSRACWTAVRSPSPS